MSTDVRAEHAIEGLRAREGAPYLGDRNTVWKVLSDMVQQVAEDPHTTEAAVSQATDILCGENGEYAPMGPWNESDDGGIGDWIRGHMNGVPAEGGNKAAVEYALSHLALHEIETTRAITEDAMTPEQAGARMRSLMSNWTNLMLGVPASAKAE